MFQHAEDNKVRAPVVASADYAFLAEAKAEAQLERLLVPVADCRGDPFTAGDFKWVTKQLPQNAW